jgi:hypothetical protein
MIEVHSPHERISGFRDFLLHLLTITIGLLIALGLEGCVEWWHHRNLRNEADARLHQEITDNQKELAATRSAVAKERENLISILKFLKARSANRPYDISQLSIHFEMGTLRNASWRTASATGALGYMEYPQVQRYASAYQVQDDFAAVQSRTLEEFLQLESYGVFEFDPKKMSPADAQAASTDVQRTIAHLIAMDQIGDGLAKSYREALRRE